MFKMYIIVLILLFSLSCTHINVVTPGGYEGSYTNLGQNRNVKAGFNEETKQWEFNSEVTNEPLVEAMKTIKELTEAAK